MVTHKFTNPPHPQSKSRLARLPAELRLQISRLLLRHPDIHNQCLDYSDITNSRKSILAGTRLARTCQQFYREVMHVFYTENMLVFKFEREASVIRFECSLLNTLGYLTTDLDIICKLNPDTDIDSHFAPCIIDGRFVRLLECLSEVWSKFESFEFGLRSAFSGETFPEDVAVICRIFKDIVHNKRLAIDWNLGIPYIYDGSLDGCKILSCKSLEINNQKAPREIMQYIDGSVQVRDTYKEWHQLCTNILRYLPLYLSDYDSERAFLGFFDASLKVFERTVWRYDSERFTMGIRQILQEALAWKRGLLKNVNLRTIDGLRTLDESALALTSSRDRNLVVDFLIGLENDDKQVLENDQDKPWVWEAW